MTYLAINALSIALVFLAGWMMYLDKPNWGWVIVAALCCSVYPKTIKNKD